MATRLRLVCHAATAASRAAAFPDDESLEAAALGRLERFASQVRGADRWWTSPARRARQTAQALQIEAGVEPDLREIDYGGWRGRDYADVQIADPEAVSVWMGDPASTPHGGSSLLDLMARVAAWLDRQAQTPGTVVAVTHASVIRAAIIHAIGAAPGSFWRIDVAPLAMARLSHHDGRWTLNAIGPMQARPAQARPGTV